MRALPGAAAIGLSIVLMVALASRESTVVIQHVPQPAPSATIIFGGDLLFDRSIRTAIREQGGDYIFSCIDATLKGADLVVANLEGPITNNPSVSENTKPGSENNFTFTFDPMVAALLYFHNIRLVNIGNNHIMNYGLEGLRQTKFWLQSAGVDFFGDEVMYTTTLRGVPLAFINYNEFGGDSYSNVLQNIGIAAAQGYIPIVYTHWGEEYVAPLPRVQALAREFVDAGAALVVGSHPHIVQERELYHGKYIYYSLGNFIFDQYFSEDVSNGLLLSATITKEGSVTIIELPIVLGNDRRTCLIR
ncbi:MAG: CapA family protein [Patescibacteria group bacterium]